MLFRHKGLSPVVEAGAWVAPDATLCGDVTVATGARVLHGARLVAEGGRIRIGLNCIVFENAVIRSTARFDCRIGDHCLIGPHAHVVGATLDEQVFVATGGSVLHGARIGKGAEVRVGAIVHLRTVLGEGDTVPIGWVAVGDPAAILPPDRHDEIWALQKPLDFPGAVYGQDRSTPNLMIAITRGLSDALGSHEADEPLDG